MFAQYAEREIFFKRSVSQCSVNLIQFTIQRKTLRTRFLFLYFFFFFKHFKFIRIRFRHEQLNVCKKKITRNYAGPFQRF